MSGKSNNEKWEDYAIKTVTELRNNGDLIASFFLCSAFVEHYCKTRLFIFLTANRPIEIIKIPDKKTKEMKNASIWSEMKEIIFEDIHSSWVLINIGFLVGAWDKKLYDQLEYFNGKRNHLVHRYENILQILEKDEGKKEATSIIELGLSILHNIKVGHIDS